MQKWSIEYKHVSRALKGAATVGATEAASDGLRKKAEKVRKEARRNAPRRTGALGASISVSETTKGASIQSGRHLKYGSVIHYGWKARNIEENQFIGDAVENQDLEQGILDAFAKSSAFKALNFKKG